MIHVKALVYGLLILVTALAAFVCVIQWPLVLFPVVVLGAAYCIGRGVLDLKPHRHL